MIHSSQMQYRGIFVFNKVYDFLSKNKEAKIIKVPVELAPDEKKGNRFTAHYNWCTVSVTEEFLNYVRTSITTFDLLSERKEKIKEVSGELEEIISQI